MRYKLGIRQIFCFLMTCIFITFSFSRPVFAEYGETEQDNEGETTDYGFAIVSSTVGSAMNIDIAEENTGAWGDVTDQSAGGLLGFVNKFDARSTVGLILQTLSNNSVTADYKAYMSSSAAALNSIGGSGSGSIFSNYLALGAVMHDLGLDESDSAVGTVGFLHERGINGGIAMAVYIVSQFGFMVFNLACELLKKFNPFGLFSEISTDTLGNTGFLSYLKNTTNNTDNALSGGAIARFVGKVYDALFEFGWIVLVVLFGILLFKVFLPGQRGQRWAGIKKWFIQGLFIIGGVAILGGTYTKILDMLSSSTTQGNSAAVKIIASTFFDFESWVYAGMPAGSATLRYKLSDNGTIRADSSCNPQDVCYALNTATQSYNGIVGIDSALGGDANISGGSLKTVFEKMFNNGSGNPTQHSAQAGDWVMSVLTRYMAGKKVYGSSYESLWKSNYWMQANTPKTLKDIWSKYLSEPKKLQESMHGGTGFKVSDDMLANPGGSSTARNPFAPGTGGVWGNMSAANDISSTRITFASGGGEGDVNVNGMSAMSIYNYLNTKFGSSSFTVYSSNLASSDYVRDSHYAVNLVGNGINSTLFFWMCIVMLLTYAIIAFFFAFSMIIDNLKRGIRMIIALPGAMLGSVMGIAKVVSYVVLMILEIIINIMLYNIMTELIYTFATTIGDVIPKAFQALGVDAAGNATDFLLPVSTGLIIASLLWFTKEAMKLRKPIIQGFEEAADNVVQKFITGTTAAERRAAASKEGGSAAAPVAGAAAAVAGAGKHKGASGMDNLVPLVAGAKNASAAYHANKAKSEAEGNLIASEMGLVPNKGTSSAYEEGINLDNYGHARMKAKMDMGKDLFNGAMRVRTGAGKMVLGAATGNAAIAGQGAADTLTGQQDMFNAGTNATNNLAAAANDAAVANGGKNSIAAAMAPQNNTEVPDFDPKEEVANVAGAAAGAAAGGATVASAADKAGAMDAAMQGLDGNAIAGEIGSTGKRQFIGMDSDGNATVQDGNATQEVDVNQVLKKGHKNQFDVDKPDSSERSVANELGAGDSGNGGAGSSGSGQSQPKKLSAVIDKEPERRASDTLLVTKGPDGGGVNAGSGPNSPQGSSVIGGSTPPPSPGAGAGGGQSPSPVSNVSGGKGGSAPSERSFANQTLNPTGGSKGSAPVSNSGSGPAKVPSGAAPVTSGGSGNGAGGSAGGGPRGGSVRTTQASQSVGATMVHGNIPSADMDASRPMQNQMNGTVRRKDGQMVASANQPKPKTPVNTGTVNIGTSSESEVNQNMTMRLRQNTEVNRENTTSYKDTGATIGENARGNSGSISGRMSREKVESVHEVEAVQRTNIRRVDGGAAGDMGNGPVTPQDSYTYTSVENVNDVNQFSSTHVNAVDMGTTGRQGSGSFTPQDSYTASTVYQDNEVTSIHQELVNNEYVRNHKNVGSAPDVPRIDDPDDKDDKYNKYNNPLKNPPKKA